MTLLHADVVRIVSCEHLTLVYFNIEGEEAVMMSLEMAGRLREGDRVVLGVKPTDIELARGACETTCANRLPSLVETIEKGTLLSRLVLKAGKSSLEAVVLRSRLEELGIAEGDEVTALFGASALSVVEFSVD